MNKNKYFSLIISFLFILGVLFGKNNFKISFLISCLIFLALLCFAAYKTKRLLTCSIFLYATIFLLGMIITKKEYIDNEDKYELNNIDAYFCISLQTVKLNNKFTSCTFLLKKIKKKNIWIDLDIIVKIQLIINDSKKNLGEITYGDSFVIKNSPRKIHKNTNSKFDFKKYYANKGIHYNQFIDSSKMLFLKNIQIFKYKNFFENVKKKLKYLLTCKIKDLGAKTILSNLIFGEGDNIPKKLKESYSITGLSHILAISGLHIGLIFLIISSFLSLFVKSQKIKSVVAIIIIWIYGFLICMPTSVLRAILMLTFFLCNKILNRNSVKYASILNSALLSLMLNPLWISSIGFQLSYGSTFGIIYFYKHIYTWLRNKTFINERILRLVSLSVSSQVCIFPLILYHFHRINILSIVQNLIIVPLIPIVILFSFLTIISNIIPQIHTIFSLTLTIFLKVINHIVLTSSSFKIFIVHINNFSFFHVILYYIVFYLVYSFMSFYRRNNK